jgi:transposase
VFWFGYKGHLAVGTDSQYIIQSLFSSGSLNDGKAAIPLLKGIEERLPSLSVQFATMDAGYDHLRIYQQVHRMGAHSVIAYNPRNEQELDGFDEHFAPTCVREHSYRYDSYDPHYQTLKYTRPKECGDCPLADDTLCQKVYKVKITQDLRRYSAPARGSKRWKSLYNERTAVERVNAYLKGFFQLNNIRYRTGKRAKVHFDLVHLVYNATRLAIDRLNASKKAEQAAA